MRLQSQQVSLPLQPTRPSRSPSSRVPGDGDYGQNIGAGITAGNISALLTNLLYNGEIENYPLPYGQKDPAGLESWGHYSQMVWSDTTSVGCYTYDCSPPGQPATQDCDPSGQSYLANTNCGSYGTPAVFTVCNYYPEGERFLFFWNASPMLYGETNYVGIGNVDGQFDSVKAPLGHGIVQMTGNGLTGPGV